MIPSFGRVVGFGGSFDCVNNCEKADEAVGVTAWLCKGCTMHDAIQRGLAASAACQARARI